MTGIFTSRATAGKPRCARCGRPFTPKKEGQTMGDKCARKEAARQAVANDLAMPKGTLII